MLSIEHLSAAYGTRVVLNDVSLQTHPGEIVGVVGPNGAGKSSLLRVISGTLSPTQGKILLDDIELTRLGAALRARRVAVVPQSLHLPEAFTAGEVVLMGRTPHLPLFGGERPHDYKIVREALTRTATATLAKRRIGELSGGEQQRVLIARALAQITDGATSGQEQRVLLLDEATGHLDLKHQTTIWGLVRELARSGLIVIAALHDLNLAAQYADRLALLSDGRLLICEKPAQVLTSEWLRLSYDVSAIVSSHPLYATPLVALVGEGGDREQPAPGGLREKGTESKEEICDRDS